MGLSWVLDHLQPEQRTTDGVNESATHVDS
jgi:hypothetical protein